MLSMLSGATAEQRCAASAKQTGTRDRNFGHLKCHAAAVADELRTDLDQLFPQARERPVRDCYQRRKRTQKVSKIAGRCLKLQPNGICIERAARKPRPLDRALAFLDPLFGRSTLVVERNDIVSRYFQVRDYEADPREEFAWMPFTLATTRPRMRPTHGLVAKLR
jgi:hypothetical protein